MSEVLMKFGTSPCCAVATFKLPENLPNSLKNERALSKYVNSQNQLKSNLIVNLYQFF